jgi:glyoxylase-like metal-dependent hydrolase (beta-lactamase superfamily II)
VVVHELDADAVESGDPRLTAASWYGTRLPRVRVDQRLRGEHEVLSVGGTELHCVHTPGHTPGSIGIYLDRGGKRVLFGQDIHGPFSAEFDSDISAWRESMEKLIGLQADILCEGHFGIFSGKKRVEAYIRGYLDQYAGSY